MILPPCLSLVLALVPTVQEPSPTPVPWIELPPGRQISAVSLKNGVLSIDVVESVSGLILQTENYDQDSYPRGGAKPTSIVEGGRVVAGPPKDIRRAIPPAGDPGRRVLVSSDDLTAIVVEQPSHLGGVGEVTLYTNLGEGPRFRSRKRSFSSFINANLAPDGTAIYVQVSAHLEQWGWEEFLGDGTPTILSITGEYTDVYRPGSDKRGQFSDYLLLQTPTALEVYRGKQPKPRNINPPQGSGPVPINAAVGTVDTNNYATAVHMDAVSGYLVVTDRRTFSLRRVVEGNRLLDLGGLTPRSRGAEIRSCWFVPPSAVVGSPVPGGPVTAVLGLVRNAQVPTVNTEGHCQVSAWVLDCNPTAKAKPTVRFKTPWLSAERWSRTSPHLHIAEDGHVLFVSTNGRVWRFEVTS